MKLLPMHSFAEKAGLALRLRKDANRNPEKARESRASTITNTATFLLIWGFRVTGPTLSRHAH